jgi:hypothetical protein
MLLASVLIFTVIFSSGSESPTYIIAFAGVSIWFMIQEFPGSKGILFLFVFAFLLTSMSPSDLFPKIYPGYLYQTIFTQSTSLCIGLVSNYLPNANYRF